MSRTCEICGKSYKKGNLVPRGVGRRVTHRTIHRQQPNLRVKRFVIEGTPVKVRLCAACLKKIKNQSKEEVSE